MVTKQQLHFVSALEKNMNPDVQGKTKRTLSKKLKQLKSAREHSRRVVRRVNPTQAHESRIYSDYALLYDKTFGKIFYSRIKHVIESLHIPPEAEVLELGVGTGTSFPAYPSHCKVMGVDLAADMLVQARAKISKNSWSHLQVIEMDALTEALDPLTCRLGWRTKLKLKPFLQATDFTVEEIYKLSKGSLYTVIRGRVV